MITQKVCRQDLTNAVIHILGLLNMMESNLGRPLDRLSTQDVAAVKLAYDFARYWSELAEAELLEGTGSSDMIEKMFQRLDYLGKQKN